MPRIPISNLGQYGVINEVPDEGIPLNAWTKATNVDFRDGIAKKSNGYTNIFGANTQVTTPFDGLICQPQWMLPYVDPETDTLYWIICGIDDGAAVYPGGIAGDPVICTFDGTQILDRTGTDITVSGPTVWTGGVCNGIPIVNTGLEEPQMWSRTSGTLKASFEALTNWPAGYTADTIRVFKDFIVALSVDDGTNAKNPWRVMWSDAADPFTAPSWTASASTLAGDVTIGEGGAFLIDCLPLRGANIIYSTQETWMMRKISGNSVFAFDRIFSEYGILAKRCAKPFKDGMHFVVTVGDIIVHDGNTAQSIIDARTRDKLFMELDTTNYDRSFVCPNYKESEMLFFYPTTGNTWPNKVAKWNIKTNTWSFNDLGIDTSHAGFGVVNAALGANVTFDSDTDTIDSDTTTFNEGSYNPSQESIIIAEYGSTTGASNVHKGDDSNTNNGTAFYSELERTGIDFGDNGVVKHCDEVWIECEGGPIDVTVGYSNKPDQGYTWEPSVSFDPASDYKIDCRSTGRFLGFRFSSVADVAWSLNKYTPNIEEDGER